MQIRSKILEVITDIQEQNERSERPVSDNSQMIQDLGFTSLDVAELIADLEMDLDLDPFSNGMSLLDIHTVGDFCRVYEETAKQNV